MLVHLLSGTPFGTPGLVLANRSRAPIHWTDDAQDCPCSTLLGRRISCYLSRQFRARAALTGIRLSKMPMWGSETAESGSKCCDCWWTARALEFAMK